MREGLVGLHAGKFFERRGAERASGGGEDEAADFFVFAGAEALVDGVVFAIDGDDFGAALVGRGDNDFAGGDEDFLIGEGDFFAGLDGFVGGFEADDADSGGDDCVGFGNGGDGFHAFIAKKNFGEEGGLRRFEAID